MSSPKIVLQNSQTELAECLDIIEEDAAIAAENAEADGQDPDAAALAHPRMMLHSIADSLVMVEDGAPKKRARKKATKKKAAKKKPGRPKKKASRTKKNAAKKRK